jgi:hypothetical protein
MLIGHFALAGRLRAGPPDKTLGILREVAGFRLSTLVPR